MDSGIVVLDISSDEDCGDVIKIKSRLPSLQCDEFAFDDDDDDCVVLEGDPDAPAVVAQEKGLDSDDLLVVGEKGQLACRDYPHPRHLCATFPFNSTLHASHCTQCHCYVCDSLAPCTKWGNGSFFTDHCHATDKEQTWKEQRLLKKSKSMGYSAVQAHGVQTFNNAGEISHVESSPVPTMAHALRPSTPCLRTSQQMTPPSNLQVVAPVQANVRYAHGTTPNKTHAVAPASRVTRKERQGGNNFTLQVLRSCPYYRKKSPAQLDKTRQWQVGMHALPHYRGHSPSPISSSMNRQSSTTLSCTSRHSFTTAMPRAIQRPPVEISNHRNYVAAPRMSHNNPTAPVPQRNEQAVPSLGNYQPPVDSITKTDFAINEIIAGLHSNLGLPCENIGVEFNLPSAPFVCDIGNHPSQACPSPNTDVDITQAQVPTPNPSILSHSAPSHVSQDAAGHASMAVQQPHGMDGRTIPGHASMVAQQPHRIHGSTIPVSPPRNNFNMENFDLQGQLLYFDWQGSSMESLNDPGVLPPDPPDLTFDFEDF